MRRGHSKRSAAELGMGRGDQSRRSGERGEDLEWPVCSQGCLLELGQSGHKATTEGREIRRQGLWDPPGMQRGRLLQVSSAAELGFLF